MDFATKGKVIAGCNWLMAGAGIATSVYVFALIFSVPPDVEPNLQSFPAAETQPAPVTATAAPKITATVPQPAQSATPARTQAAPRPMPQAPAAQVQGQAQGQAQGNVNSSSDAPHVRHPGTPQPALNPATIPPGLGKDF